MKKGLRWMWVSQRCRQSLHHDEGVTMRGGTCGRVALETLRGLLSHVCGCCDLYSDIAIG
jgi:hypothetical protein